MSNYIIEAIFPIGGVRFTPEYTLPSQINQALSLVQDFIAEHESYYYRNLPTYLYDDVTYHLYTLTEMLREGNPILMWATFPSWIFNSHNLQSKSREVIGDEMFVLNQQIISICDPNIGALAL